MAWRLNEPNETKNSSFFGDLDIRENTWLARYCSLQYLMGKIWIHKYLDQLELWDVHQTSWMYYLRNTTATSESKLQNVELEESSSPLSAFSCPKNSQQCHDSWGMIIADRRRQYCLAKLSVLDAQRLIAHSLFGDDTRIVWFLDDIKHACQKSDIHKSHLIQHQVS